MEGLGGAFPGLCGVLSGLGVFCCGFPGATAVQSLRLACTEGGLLGGLVGVLRTQGEL